VTSLSTTTEKSCPKCAAQAKEITELRAELSFLREQHNLAIHRQFGRSSEQSPVGQEAFVFNEVEVFACPVVPDPPVEEAVKPRAAKTTGKRREQIALLDTRDEEHPASDEQKVCSCCGQEMHFVDWQVRQEVEFIPARLTLVNHKQPIYACRDCQEAGEDAPIRTIKTMPEPAFPKSLASPSLVSHIITQKFVMGTPLYRQEHNMEGLGVLFSRQTMANWTLRAASLIEPIFGRMHQILLTRDIIQADETKVQVLHEPDRKATTGSTMWLYRSGRDGPPIALFEYQTSRAGYHAKAFLAGFGQYDPETKTIARQKYLQADGHEGYDTVPIWALIDGEKRPDIIIGGCFSHARRKFHEISASIKPAERKSGKRIAADEGLKHCNDLFELEREFRDMSPDERYAARLHKSAPKLDEFKAWLDKTALEALPKTAIGTAIGYCLSQWSKLTTYLLDGRLEIDNNRAERSIKPFVIGRKNWLFANTPQGANASATLYSMIETAKENGLIPFEYMKHLLERLPNVDTRDPAAIDSLLPWSGTLPQTCRKP
jgi:transposase